MPDELLRIDRSTLNITSFVDMRLTQSDLFSTDIQMHVEVCPETRS